MSAELIQCTVEEIAEPTKNALVGGPFGSNLVSKDYVEAGVPVIRGQNMGYGRWVAGDFVFVSTQKADVLSANTARPGDLIFTQRGTLGQVAIVPQEPYENYIISQSQMKLSVDSSKADAQFLYYLFCSPEQQHYIKTHAIQVGVPHTNLGILKATPLKLPSLWVQQNVAEVLSVFDDKIELNLQINQTLEQMAQAIFKSWFVDFEPVKAKIAAKTAGLNPERAAMCAISGKREAELDQLSTEQCQQLAATAALFPDELVESELGLIPKGWEIKEIGTILELVYGKALPKEQRRDGSIPVYGSGGIGGFHDSALAQGPGIVVGRKGTVGSVYWVSTDFFAIDTVFYVRLLREVPLYWAYEQLRRIDIASLGADSAVPGVNRNTVHAQHIAFPGDDLLITFWKDVEPLVSMQETQNKHSETLTTLRDALLPKLLSGELTVSPMEAEA
jgi:type I restriction enzyme S subunit